MSRRRSLIGWVVFFFALLWLVTPFVGKVHAAFPEKPLTIIVPFSAGGGVDGLARALASRLEKELGVPVVVKNEGGSGGRRGSITLFKSPTDGYTIGLPHFATLLYDTVLGKTKPPIDYTQFPVILRVDTTTFYLYTNKKTPFYKLEDFKAAGRPIKFASSGVGNPSWLVPQALSASMGFPVSFVTGHKNLAESALAVARGDVDAAAGSYTHFQGVLDDVRPLAYMSDEASYHLPEVPTIVEIGYPKLASLGVPWVLAAPPGTPEEKLSVIRRALKKVTMSDEFRKWAKDAGYNPTSQGPQDFWKSMAEMKEVYESIKTVMEKK